MKRTPQVRDGQYEMLIQAGGQHVFEKLHPERFPLCGGGVLPPVLISRLLARVLGATAETAFDLRMTALCTARSHGRRDLRRRTK